MLWLFSLTFAAMLSQGQAVASAILLVAYSSLAVLDPIAARRGEVPTHLARLRPPQMAPAIVGLLLMLAFLGSR